METDVQIIYHITPADYFNSLPADQPYRPREFDRDGYIHCTKGEERMLLVADTVYRRVPGDFLLLAIDERKVAAPVQYENVGGMMFPHIYGPLNRDAIVRVVAMGRREDGTFLPIGDLDAGADRAAATEAWLSQARVEQLLAESENLRARTIERLTRIERDIAALKKSAAVAVTPSAPVASAAAVASAAPAAPVAAATPSEAAAPTPPSTLEARMERVERSLHQLAARIESLEQQAATLQKPVAARTHRRVARRSPVRRK